MANRFNTFMEGDSTKFSSLTGWFPAQEVIVDGAVHDDGPLLVDIVGGRGHQLVAFEGQLVLEEPSPVVNNTTNLTDEIQVIAHDFFTPQPVKGARAYYMKHILHDWSDENCHIILKHIATAMERGYSKLLIEEYIGPDDNASPATILLDLIVMTWCPGAERTRQQWTSLLQSAGLAITKFWVPEGDKLGIIEVESIMACILCSCS